MAKERFIVFSSVEVFVYVIKFIIAYLLVSHFESKLFIYTATMAIMTALPAIIYCLYCKRYFPEYVKWNFVRDKGIYAKVFRFQDGLDLVLSLMLQEIKVQFCLLILF